MSSVRRSSRRECAVRCHQLQLEALEKRYALNAAPVLDTAPYPYLDRTPENSGVPSSTSGTLVSRLIDAGGRLNNYSDSDGDLPGIAITSVNLEGGTLWYTTDAGGTWVPVLDVTATPLLLNADEVTRLYFQPATNFSGTIQDVISFKAWDRSLTWVQQGLDINGLTAGENAGNKIAVSADGTTLAVGAGRSDSNGVDAGIVRVYRWSGFAWSQLGASIYGEAAGDSMEVVALSADGSTLAVGAALNDGNGVNAGHVRIFRWSEGVGWVQLGLDLNGEAAGDKFGQSVSLSADGSTIAVGAPNNDGTFVDAGNVRVFRWTGSTWGQVGAAINGKNSTDSFGCAVSLSADGATVLIGAERNDATGTNAGSGQVYRWNGVDWQQLGTSINGEAANDYSGKTLALSADGQTVAIAASANSGNGTEAGHVRIYRWTGSSWSKLGADIDGELPGNKLGLAVSLSDDGTTVVIGAPSFDGAGTAYGRAYVFSWDGAAWKDVGESITGTATGERAGTSTSISADGRTVVIASPGAAPNNLSNAGLVRVYQLQRIAGKLSIKTETASVTVSRVNKAPLLDPNVALSLSPIIENSGPPLGETGVPIESLIGNISPLISNFSDEDGDQPGIAVVKANLQGGALWYTTNAGTEWVQADDISETNPLFLAATPGNRIYYQPLNNFVGTISDVLTIRAWDRTVYWRQLGQDIDGELPGDLSGSTTAISADGKTIAIGAIGNGNPVTFQAGHVRVFRFIDSNWIQLGEDLDGEAFGDSSGSAISLSTDGETVAIGAPLNDGNGTSSGHVRIYRWNGTVWSKLGDDKDGEAADDQSAGAISLSADGKVVAVGSYLNDGSGQDAGHVRIFEWLENVGWTQRGDDVDGAIAGDRFGSSVSLSADGLTLAVGASTSNGSGKLVRVYSWDGVTWQKQGTDITGGSTVVISGNGATIAVAGVAVRIYDWIGATWTQRGDDVAANDGITELAISYDGQKLIGGAPQSNANDDASGLARAYEWNGTSWRHLGSDIAGIAAHHRLGAAVSMSATGQLIAVGAPLYRKAGILGQGAGVVRVYDSQPDLTSLSTAVDTITVTVEPSTAFHPVSLSPAYLTRPENQGSKFRTKISDIQIADNGIGVNTVTLSGPDAHNFEIDGLSLYIKPEVAFDYEQQNLLLVQIDVANTLAFGNEVASAVFPVTVTDVNEHPTSVALSPQSAALLTKTDTTSPIRLTDIQVQDDNLGANVISLSGNDADSFFVYESGLFLRAGVLVDYDIKNSYSLVITVADTSVLRGVAVSTSFSLMILNPVPSSDPIFGYPLGLAKDAAEKLYVGTTPLFVEGSHSTININDFAVLGAKLEESGGTLLVSRGAVRYRLLADETWKINSLFSAIRNETAPALDRTARGIAYHATVTLGPRAFLIGGQQNPTITVRRNQTFTFDLNTPGHPFYLQIAGGGYQASLVYAIGFDGNGQTVGRYRWLIAGNTPDEIYYQSGLDSTVFGKINVVD